MTHDNDTRQKMHGTGEMGTRRDVEYDVEYDTGVILALPIAKSDLGAYATVLM